MTPRSLIVPQLRVRHRLHNRRNRNRKKNRKLIKHKRIKSKDRLIRHKPLLCNFIDIPKDCFSARWRLLKLQDYFSDKEFKKAYKLIDKIKNIPENPHTCRYFPKKVSLILMVNIHQNTFD